MNLNRALQATVFSAVSTLTLPALAVTDAEFRALQEQLNQLADAMDKQSGGHSAAGDTSIGGYGELHFNSLRNPSGPSKREIDFHRFVLFINHEFSSDIRLFTELELEHSLAGEGKPGEVELEQAYVQFDVGENSTINAGLFLLPVGILNETHEPPTFYGVERNPVEKNIIPTTWWEGGVMFSSNTGNSGISYDLALHSGLDGGTNIRGGRQKVAEAKANDLAVTARIKYTGIAGLELAATAQYQNDMTQDSFDNIDGATLLETHAVVNKGAFSARALYARWDIDGTGATTTETDVQDGMYVELGYKVTPKVGVFARQSVWDNGGAGDTEKKQSDFGVNYWPHEDVVIKADYQAQDENAGDSDGVNLGIGFQF